jgi:hypothetical protein
MRKSFPPGSWSRAGSSVKQQRWLHHFPESLMNALDNINFSMRDDVIKFASSGTNNDWKMRREFHSPRYTSRWNELAKVN